MEDALDRAHVGITASELVRLLSEESEAISPEEHPTYYLSVQRRLLLVYERINGRMRIGFDELTIRSTAGGAEVTRQRDGAIPRDQAPRDAKIAGVVVLPVLINQIVTEASSLIGAAEAALRDKDLAAMVAAFVDEDRPRRRVDFDRK